MRKRNEDIKNEMNKSNILRNEVAESLGVSESTLYRWLRSEMPEKRKRTVMEAIKQLKQDMQLEEK